MPSMVDINRAGGFYPIPKRANTSRNASQTGKSTGRKKNATDRRAKKLAGQIRKKRTGPPTPWPKQLRLRKRRVKRAREVTRLGLANSKENKTVEGEV